MLWQRIVETARRQSPQRRWALALLMFATALCVRLASARFLAGLPAITYLPAIVGATLLCGWPQAVVVLLLSLVSGIYLFMPTHPIGGDSYIKAVFALIMFVLVGAFEIFVINALMVAVRDNHRLAQQQKTLFLELQHRVANTLQFVASMLNLARGGIATPAQASDVLEQAAARVTAMGQLHRRMYDAASDDRGFEPLLRDILQEIFKDLAVKVTVQADISRVPLAQMTPIVLLVTEAATNSAKHVFRAGQGTYFEVLLLATPHEKLRLTIRDDGPGVPAPAPPSSGLGLKIMQGLASQLGGKLNLETSRGTVISVEFAPA